MAKAFLDLPSEGSLGLGASVVLPDYSAPVGTEEWFAEAEARMQKLADEAWRKREWSRFIFLHTRSSRWRALWSVAVALGPSPKLAELFREVWVDSEDIWRERRLVRKLIRLIAPNPKYRRRLFTAADWRTLRALPDRLTVYRGAKDWNRNGMSWTLDPYRAAYFATHHNDSGMMCTLGPDHLGFVMERTVRKSSVLFYTSDRSEDEVVLTRFEKGRISPEGMIWAADQCGGWQIMADELERHREHLSPEMIRFATLELDEMKAEAASAKVRSERAKAKTKKAV